ncbi:MAG: polysaccharide pyruvyl transferase CsaB [Bacillota bacterium]|nr:polysaccharide pyruvyl transferase CsaB [Bacillota bacterium]
MKKVFIFGYYGFHNIGDEAILEAIVAEFQKVMPEVSLTALSYKAAETSRRYSIEAVSRNHFVEVVRSIGRSHLVMSGGGSILQDVTSSRSLLYYLGIIFLAKILGKKVAFYGNGFGPITRTPNRWLVKHIINQVDLLTVRDEESREVMERLGISRPIHVTADAAFTLQILPESEPVQLDQVQRKVGISVRRWKNQAVYLPILAAFADALIEKGYTVFFLPMQPPADTQVSKELMNMMKYPAIILETGDTPHKMIQVIAGMDFLIGMRLHSLIFSAIAGVPMIGLSYETKITSFLKLVQQPCAGDVETLTYEQLTKTTDAFLVNQEEYRRKVKTHQQELKKKAAENALMIRSFLLEGEESK